MSEKDLSKVKMMTDCDIVLMIPGRRDRKDGGETIPQPGDRWNVASIIHDYRNIHRGIITVAADSGAHGCILSA